MAHAKVCVLNINKDKKKFLIVLFSFLTEKKNFISFLCTFNQLKQKNGSANESSLKIYVSTKILTTFLCIWKNFSNFFFKLPKKMYMRFLNFNQSKQGNWSTNEISLKIYASTHILTAFQAKCIRKNFINYPSIFEIVSWFILISKYNLKVCFDFFSSYFIY